MFSLGRRNGEVDLFGPTDLERAVDNSHEVLVRDPRSAGPNALYRGRIDAENSTLKPKPCGDRRTIRVIYDDAQYRPEYITPQQIYQILDDRAVDGSDILEPQYGDGAKIFNEVNGEFEPYSVIRYDNIEQLLVAYNLITTKTLTMTFPYDGTSKRDAVPTWAVQFFYHRTTHVLEKEGGAPVANLEWYVQAQMMHDIRTDRTLLGRKVKFMLLRPQGDLQWPYDNEDIANAEQTVVLCTQSFSYLFEAAIQQARKSIRRARAASNNKPFGIRLHLERQGNAFKQSYAFWLLDNGEHPVLLKVPIKETETNTMPPLSKIIKHEFHNTVPELKRTRPLDDRSTSPPMEPEPTSANAPATKKIKLLQPVPAGPVVNM